TTENSQATKNAFRATSAAMAASFPRTTIGGSQWGATLVAIKVAGNKNSGEMFIARTRSVASEIRYRS
ncbi:MAG: hypothetical protein DMF42_10585, partial [Verrucomicrobia bacterium]